MKKLFVLLSFLALITWSCQPEKNKKEKISKNDTPPEQVSTDSQKIKIIIDSDANNELDDQHAIAYAAFNGDVFVMHGVTVNRTNSGGELEKHFEEAVRVLKLCNVYPEIPVYKGASGSYAAIKEHINEADFDGAEAVNFIIEQAKQASEQEKLVLIPIGKLTNIALAILKAPEIIKKIKVVWLGSNYPEAGEYNVNNDTTSVNPVIESGVEFEMVTVRYGKPSGTAAVTITPQEINKKMPGLGPIIEQPVTGRHGNEFTNFGDYAVNLFENIKLHGDPPSRSLFDMAAVAIVKNPEWADKKLIPAPRFQDKKWIEQPGNENKIYIWENFNKEKILHDFFQSLENYQLAKPAE